jgi:hypothetical protein
MNTPYIVPCAVVIVYHAISELVRKIWQGDDHEDEERLKAIYRRLSELDHPSTFSEFAKVSKEAKELKKRTNASHSRYMMLWLLGKWIPLLSLFPDWEILIVIVIIEVVYYRITTN